MKTFPELLLNKKVSTRVYLFSDDYISNRYLEHLMYSLCFRNRIAEKMGYGQTLESSEYKHYLYGEVGPDSVLSVVDVKTISEVGDPSLTLERSIELLWDDLDRSKNTHEIEQLLIMHVDAFYTAMNLNSKGIYNVH